jgi:hypothetical protein
MYKYISTIRQLTYISVHSSDLQILVSLMYLSLAHLICTTQLLITGARILGLVGLIYKGLGLSDILKTGRLVL